MNDLRWLELRLVPFTTHVVEIGWLCEAHSPNARIAPTKVAFRTGP